MATRRKSPRRSRQAAATPSKTVTPQAILARRSLHLPITLPTDFPIRVDIPSEQRRRIVTYMHAHDCLLLGHCRQGDGVLAIGTKVLPYRNGDTVVIAPMQFHMMWPTAGVPGRWIWAYLDPLRLIAHDDIDRYRISTAAMTHDDYPNVIRAADDPFLGAALEAIVADVRKQPAQYQASIRALVTAVMLRLQRRAPPRAGPNLDRRASAMRRISPALDLMAENFATKYDMAYWATCCHLSVTQFRRLFLQALGQAPHTYLTHLRVHMAANRLRTGNDRIIDIALACGFPTLSSFNRAFRQCMHATPRAWRDRV